MHEYWSELFCGVRDTRSVRNRKYPLASILGIAILGGLAGIDSFSGLGDFAEAHLESLRGFFDLPAQSPSHDTFQRVLDVISPEEFQKSFQVFTADLRERFPGKRVHLDGKTIRNSGARPLQVVSAWCEENHLVLGQVRVEAGGNEITALPKLLEMLSLSGKVCTIDAIGCQRKICRDIVEKGGDYVIAVKANQKGLHEDIRALLEDPALQAGMPGFAQSDKGHGRLELRRSIATGDVGYIQEMHGWPGLQSVGMVVSEVTKGKTTTRETRFYVSSLPADAEALCLAARAHWGIENQLHWRLDVVFNEDRACISNENGAENMNIIRKWAIHLLYQAKDKPDRTLKSLQRKAAMSFDFLTSILHKYLHA